MFMGQRLMRGTTSGPTLTSMNGYVEVERLESVTGFM